MAVKFFPSPLFLYIAVSAIEIVSPVFERVHVKKNFSLPLLHKNMSYQSGTKPSAVQNILVRAQPRREKKK